MTSAHSPAPDFSLPDQEGNVHSLSDYKGKWVIVYFYPKDDTPGCTKEACGFRDMNQEFAKHNAIVLGISTDSVMSHAKFAEKYHLTFPILSDESAEVIKAYDSWKQTVSGEKTSFGTQRNTLLIDPEGKIAHVYTNVDPLAHPQEILQDLP